MSSSLQSHGLIACQAPLSVGFSRQEYWSGLLCPSPEDLSDLGIEPGSPHHRQILYHLSHQGMSAASQALGTHVLPSRGVQAAPEGNLCCLLHSWRISGFSADMMCGGQSAKGQGSCESFSCLYA